MEPDPKAFRIAATVLLVRDNPFEVLVVRRHSKATFASRLVFPGGVVDPDDSDEEWMPLLSGADDLTVDERALRICAIRETWEETSILIGAATAPEGMPGAPFREVVRASGGTLALDHIHPFGHWITPDLEPRRFDTHFFLAAAPGDQVAVADGGETVGLQWIEVHDHAADGLMFPTIMNLQRLAESNDSASAISAAAARAPFTVRPAMVKRDDGSYLLTIPAEAGYSVTEFVHR